MMQVLDTVEVYDPATDTWNTAAPMPTARCCLAAVPAPDGRIYAVGGAMMHNNVFRPLDTVEAYNPATNAWSAVAPLPAPRMGLAAATGSDGRIYVMGGADLIGGILSTVEAYNPSTNRWTAVAPMPTARSSLTAVTGSDGRIDAIGGFDSSFSVLTTVESYDPATNTWSAAPSMPTPRCCLAAAPGPDNRIFVLGGSGDNSTDSALSTVEAYTPRQGAAGRVTTSI
jgi:kelch-like protein 17 (actinfilin)/kelch-like protein 20